MTTILIAADEDKGVIDVNPEEEEKCGDGHGASQATKGYVYTTETQEYNCQGVIFNKKCTHGTQTELLRTYHVAESV